MPYLDDLNVPEPLGVGPINTNVRNGERVSTWNGYLAPVDGDNGLTICTEAHVIGLKMIDTRCVGVTYVKDGQEEDVFATQEIILTAGAIDSPRLLMLAGIGDSARLRSIDVKPVVDLPGVGRNLQEHVILGGLCFESRDPLPEVNNNLEGSICFWPSNANAETPDLMFIPVQIPYVSSEIANAYPVPENAFCLAPGLVNVKSRGHVRLTTAKPDGPLEIQPNMLADQADLDALVRGVEIGLELASQPSLRTLIGSWIAPPNRLDRKAVIEFVRMSAMPYFHPVGTCAMGTDPWAVVDPELRVHGVDGLRVADASIMPVITSTNTNAPTVMIAEKAAATLLAAQSTTWR